MLNMGIQAPGQRPAAAAANAHQGPLKDLSNEAKKYVDMVTQFLTDRADGKAATPEAWEALAHQRDCMAPADNTLLRAASKDGTRELLTKVLTTDPRPAAKETAQSWLGMLEHSLHLPGFGAAPAGAKGGKGWSAE
jgi:hypothetical protein